MAGTWRPWREPGSATVEPEEGKNLHVRRILTGALVLIVIGAAANLLGWNIRSWLKSSGTRSKGSRSATCSPASR